MQLYAKDINAAIKELEIAIPLAGLQNVIEHRVAAHKPRGDLRRIMELLRALQIVREVSA